MDIKLKEDSNHNYVIKMTDELELSDFLSEIPDKLIIKHIRKNNTDMEIRDLFGIDETDLSDFDDDELVSELLSNLSVRDILRHIIKEIHEKIEYDSDLIEITYKDKKDVICELLEINTLSTFEDICAEIKEKIFR